VTCHQHRGRTQKGSLRTSLALVATWKAARAPGLHPQQGYRASRSSASHAEPQGAQQVRELPPERHRPHQQARCVGLSQRTGTNNGQLGNDCSKCHSPTQHFKTCGWSGRHKAKRSRWRSAQTAKCESCHVNGRYKLGEVTLRNLHEKTEPHRGQLGPELRQVHRPEKSAQVFKHDTMTASSATAQHRIWPALLANRRGLIHPLARWTKKEVGAGRSIRRFPVMANVRGTATRTRMPRVGGPNCDECHSTPVSGACRGGRANPQAARPAPKSGCVHTADCPWGRRRCRGTGALVYPRCHARPSAQLVIAPTAPKSHTALWRLRVMERRKPSSSGNRAGCVTRRVGGSVSQKQRPAFTPRGLAVRVHGFAAAGFAERKLLRLPPACHCLISTTGPDRGEGAAPFVL